MIIKKRSVYYCGFCKKHTLTKNSMESHEKHCTANPDRQCRMCLEDSGITMDGDERRKLAGQLKGMILRNREEPVEPAPLEWLQKQVDDCPACILTVVRLADMDTGSLTNWDDSWNYKEETVRRMKELNEERAEQDERATW